MRYNVVNGTEIPSTGLELTPTSSSYSFGQFFSSDSSGYLEMVVGVHQNGVTTDYTYYAFCYRPVDDYGEDFGNASYNDEFELGEYLNYVSPTYFYDSDADEYMLGGDIFLITASSPLTISFNSDFYTGNSSDCTNYPALAYIKFENGGDIEDLPSTLSGSYESYGATLGDSSKPSIDTTNKVITISSASQWLYICGHKSTYYGTWATYNSYTYKLGANLNFSAYSDLFPSPLWANISAFDGQGYKVEGIPFVAMGSSDHPNTVSYYALIIANEDSTATIDNVSFIFADPTTLGGTLPTGSSASFYVFSNGTGTTAFASVTNVFVQSTSESPSTGRSICLVRCATTVSRCGMVVTIGPTASSSYVSSKYRCCVTLAMTATTVSDCYIRTNGNAYYQHLCSKGVWTVSISTMTNCFFEVYGWATSITARLYIIASGVSNYTNCRWYNQGSEDYYSTSSTTYIKATSSNATASLMGTTNWTDTYSQSQGYQSEWGGPYIKKPITYNTITLNAIYIGSSASTLNSNFKITDGTTAKTVSNLSAGIATSLTWNLDTSLSSITLSIKNTSNADPSTVAGSIDQTSKGYRYTINGQAVTFYWRTSTTTDLSSRNTTNTSSSYTKSSITADTTLYLYIIQATQYTVDMSLDTIVNTKAYYSPLIEEGTVNFSGVTYSVTIKTGNTTDASGTFSIGTNPTFYLDVDYTNYTTYDTTSVTVTRPSGNFTTTISSTTITTAFTSAFSQESTKPSATAFTLSSTTYKPWENAYNYATVKLTTYVTNSDYSGTNPRFAYYDPAGTVKNLALSSNGSSQGSSHTLNNNATIYEATKTNKLANITLNSSSQWEITFAYGNYVSVYAGSTTNLEAVNISPTTAGLSGDPSSSPTGAKGRCTANVTVTFAYKQQTTLKIIYIGSSSTGLNGYIKITDGTTIKTVPNLTSANTEFTLSWQYASSTTGTKSFAIKNSSNADFSNVGSIDEDSEGNRYAINGQVVAFYWSTSSTNTLTGKSSRSTSSSASVAFQSTLYLYIIQAQAYSIDMQPDTITADGQKYYSPFILNGTYTYVTYSVKMGNTTQSTSIDNNTTFYVDVTSTVYTTDRTIDLFELTAPSGNISYTNSAKTSATTSFSNAFTRKSSFSDKITTLTLPSTGTTYAPYANAYDYATVKITTYISNPGYSGTKPSFAYYTYNSSSTEKYSTINLATSSNSSSQGSSYILIANADAVIFQASSSHQLAEITLNSSSQWEIEFAYGNCVKVYTTNTTNLSDVTVTANKGLADLTSNGGAYGNCLGNATVVFIYTEVYTINFSSNITIYSQATSTTPVSSLSKTKNVTKNNTEINPTSSTTNSVSYNVADITNSDYLIVTIEAEMDADYVGFTNIHWLAAGNSQLDTLNELGGGSGYPQCILVNADSTAWTIEIYLHSGIVSGMGSNSFDYVFKATEKKMGTASLSISAGSGTLLIKDSTTEKARTTSSNAVTCDLYYFGRYTVTATTGDYFIFSLTLNNAPYSDAKGTNSYTPKWGDGSTKKTTVPGADLTAGTTYTFVMVTTLGVKPTYSVVTERIENTIETTSDTGGYAGNNPTNGTTVDSNTFTPNTNYSIKYIEAYIGRYTYNTYILKPNGASQTYTSGGTFTITTSYNSTTRAVTVTTEITAGGFTSDNVPTTIRYTAYFYDTPAKVTINADGTEAFALTVPTSMRYLRVGYPSGGSVGTFNVYAVGSTSATTKTSKGTSTVDNLTYTTYDLGSDKSIYKVTLDTSSTHSVVEYSTDDNSTWYTIHDAYLDGAVDTTRNIIPNEHLNKNVEYLPLSASVSRYYTLTPLASITYTIYNSSMTAVSGKTGTITGVTQIDLGATTGMFYLNISSYSSNYNNYMLSIPNGTNIAYVYTGIGNSISSSSSSNQVVIATHHNYYLNTVTTSSASAYVKHTLNSNATSYTLAANAYVKINSTYDLNVTMYSDVFDDGSSAFTTSVTQFNTYLAGMTESIGTTNGNYGRYFSSANTQKANANKFSFTNSATAPLGFEISVSHTMTAGGSYSVTRSSTTYSGSFTGATTTTATLKVFASESKLYTYNFGSNSSTTDSDNSKIKIETNLFNSTASAYTYTESQTKIGTLSIVETAIAFAYTKGTPTVTANSGICSSARVYLMSNEGRISGTVGYFAKFKVTVVPDSSSTDAIDIWKIEDSTKSSSNSTYFEYKDANDSGFTTDVDATRSGEWLQTQIISSRSTTPTGASTVTIYHIFAKYYNVTITNIIPERSNQVMTLSGSGTTYTITSDGQTVGTITLTLPSDASTPSISSNTIVFKIPTGRSASFSVTDTNNYFTMVGASTSNSTYSTASFSNTSGDNYTASYTISNTSTSASYPTSGITFTTSFDVYHRVLINATDMTTNARPANGKIEITSSTAIRSSSNKTYTSTSDTGYAYGYVREYNSTDKQTLTFTATYGSTTSGAATLETYPYGVYINSGTAFVTSFATEPTKASGWTTANNTGTIKTSISYTTVAAQTQSGTALDYYLTVLYVSYAPVKVGVNYYENESTINSTESNNTSSAKSTTLTFNNSTYGAVSISLYNNSSATTALPMTATGYVSVGGGFVTATNIYYKLNSKPSTFDFGQWNLYSKSSSWTTTANTGNPTTTTANLFGTPHRDYYIAQSASTATMQYSVTLDIYRQFVINLRYRVLETYNDSTADNTQWFSGQKIAYMGTSSTASYSTALDANSMMSSRFSKNVTVYISAKPGTHGNYLYRIYRVQFTNTSSTTTTLSPTINNNGFTTATFNFKALAANEGTYYIDLMPVYAVTANSEHTVETYVSQTAQNANSGAGIAGSTAVFDFSLKTGNALITYNSVLYSDAGNTIKITPHLNYGFEITGWTPSDSIAYTSGEYRLTIASREGKAYNYYSAVQMAVLEIDNPIDVNTGIVDTNGNILSGSTYENLLSSISAKVTITTDNIATSAQSYTFNYSNKSSYAPYIGYYGNFTLSVESQTNTNGTNFLFKSFGTTGTNTTPATDVTNNITGYTASATTVSTNKKTGTITITDNTSANPNTSTIVISAYFVQTMTVNIDFVSLGGTTLITEHTRILNTTTYPVSQVSSIYRHTVHIENQNTYAISFNNIIAPYYNSSDTFVKGYRYNYITVDNVNITSSISGNVISLSTASITTTTNIKVYYMPIIEVKIEVTEGKGTVTTDFINTTYNYYTYSSSKTPTTTSTANTLYASYSSKPTKGTNIASSTISSSTFTTTSTGSAVATYIYLAIGSTTHSSGNYTLLTTAYKSVSSAFVENSSDIYNRERYIPVELDYYISSYALTQQFKVGGVLATNYYDGIYNNAVYSGRQTAYSDVTITTKFESSWGTYNAGITTANINNGYVPVFATFGSTPTKHEGNHIVSANFIREYTIAINNNLSSVNSGNFVTMNITSGTETITNYSTDLDSDTRTVDFINIHAVASTAYTIVFNIPNGYDVTYHGTYYEGQTPTLTKGKYTSTTIDPNWESNSGKDAYYIDQNFIAYSTITYMVNPTHFSDSAQPIISIVQNMTDPAGSNTSNTVFGNVTSNAYVGNRVEVNNISSQGTTISATVQATSNTITLFAEQMPESTSYRFAGFYYSTDLNTTIDGKTAAQVIASSTHATYSGADAGYSLTIELSAYQNPTIIALYKHTAQTEDVIEIIGDAYVTLSYSSATTRANISDANTYSPGTKYAGFTNTVIKQSRSGTIGGSAVTFNYLILDIHCGEHSDVSSLSVGYVNELQNVTSDRNFDDATNRFVFFIGASSYGYDYNDIKTYFKIIVTTDTWLNRADNTGITTSGKTYTINSGAQLAHLLYTTSIATDSDTVIVLNGNIDLSSYLWIPVNDFRGTIQGNGYTISNIDLIGNKNIVMTGNSTRQTLTAVTSELGTAQGVYTVFFKKNSTVTYYSYIEKTGAGLFGYTNGARIYDLRIARMDYVFYNALDGINNVYNGTLIAEANNTTINNVTIIPYNTYGITYSGHASLPTKNYYISGLVGTMTGYGVIDGLTISTGVTLTTTLVGSNIYVSNVLGYANTTDASKVLYNNGVQSAILLRNISLLNNNSVVNATKSAGIVATQKDTAVVHITNVFIKVGGSSNNSTASTNSPTCITIGSVGNLKIDNVYVNNYLSITTNTQITSTSGVANNFTTPDWHYTTAPQGLRRATTSTISTDTVTIENNKTYSITSAKQLATYLKQAGSTSTSGWGANDKTYLRIANDIDLSGYNWISYDLPAKIVLDGGGYTLTGLTINNTRAITATGSGSMLNSVGLIDTIYGTVKNVRIANAYATSQAENTSSATYLGILASQASGATISQVSIMGTIELADNDNHITGIISGYTNNTQVIDSEAIGTINMGKYQNYAFYIGGAFGDVDNSTINGLHSGTNINIYGRTMSYTSGTYIGGIVGDLASSTLQNTYYGNSVSSDRVSRINEYTSSTSTAYHLLGNTSGSTITLSYSSGSINVGNNGLYYGSTASDNNTKKLYNLNGSDSNTNSTKLNAGSSNLTGFDFVNVWTNDTNVSGSTNYTYPVLIGNINAHDVTIQIITEGVEHTDDTALSGGYALDLATTYNVAGNNKYHINATDVNDYTHTKLAKAVHTNTLTTHQIQINPTTGYHIICVTLDGVDIKIGKMGDGSDTYTFDINSTITTSNGYTDIQTSFAMVSEHNIVVRFSKDFYYIESGIYDVTNKTGAKNDGSSAYTTLSNTYGTMTTTATSSVGVLSSQGKTLYTHTNSSSNWYLGYDLSDYYYIDTSGRNVNITDSNSSFAQFKFDTKTAINTGNSNIYVTPRIVGWVYVPGSESNVSSVVSNASYLYFKTTVNESGNVTVTYDYASTGPTNYIRNLIEKHYMEVTTSTGLSSTLGVQNKNDTPKDNYSRGYVNSSTIKIMPNASPNGSGIFYAMVEYVRTGVLVDHLHAHYHTLSCYDANGNVTCDDDLTHGTRHTSSELTSTYTDDYYGDGVIDPNDPNDFDRTTIQYGTFNSSQEFTMESDGDVTWGDYIPMENLANVHETSSQYGVQFKLYGFNSGMYIQKFSRTFIDISDLSNPRERTWFYEFDIVENTSLDVIYEFVNGTYTELFNRDTGDKESATYKYYDAIAQLYSVVNSNRSANDTSATFKVFEWTQNTAGEYSFYFADNLYDVTFYLNNPDAGQTTIYLSDTVYGTTGRETIPMITVRSVGGVPEFVFGANFNTTSTYTKLSDTTTTHTRSVPAFLYTLDVTIRLDPNGVVIVTSQMPTNHYLFMSMNANPKYRIDACNVDKNNDITDDSIYASNIIANDDHNNPGTKSTSYSSTINNAGIRTDAYLYYNYLVNSSISSIDKRYFYDYGKLTSTDEELEINVTYVEDYFGDFAQLGLDNGNAGTISAEPQLLSVDGTSMTATQFIQNYLVFTGAGDGKSRTNSYKINNPYKFGYLMYLIENNALYNGIPYSNYMYELTIGLSMTDRYWRTLNDFEGTIYAESTGGLYNIETFEGRLFENLSGNLINISISNAKYNASNMIGTLKGTLERVELTATSTNTTIGTMINTIDSASINQSIFELTNVSGIANQINASSITDIYATFDLGTKTSTSITTLSGFSGNNTIRNTVLRRISSGSITGAFDTNYVVSSTDTVTRNTFGALDLMRVWEFTDGFDLSLQKLTNYDKLPTVTDLRPASSSSLSGSGTKYAPYSIKTISDFALFISNMNNGIGNDGGKYYKLEADLDFKDYYIDPINVFSANFDGNGHLLKNIYLYNNDSANFALFITNAGTISKLAIDNIKIVNAYNAYDAEINIAGLVAVNNGTVIKSSVSGQIISSVANSININTTPSYIPSYTAGVIANNNGIANTIITTSYEGVNYNGTASTIMTYIYGNDYVGGIVGKATSSSTNTSLGLEKAYIMSDRFVGGVIANNQASAINNIYAKDSTLFVKDNKTAGLVITSANTTITNAYFNSTIKSNNDTANANAYVIAYTTASNSITLTHVNYLSQSVTTTIANGTLTQSSVVGGAISSLTTAVFATSNWDYVFVWALYGSTPVFKYFNDYIIQLPLGTDYYYIEADDIATQFGAENEFFTYNSTRRTAGKYIVVRDASTGDNYIIEIRLDNNVSQTGINGSTVSISNININDDHTIYMYRGSTATLNVTSVIYRHITEISLKHHNNDIADYTQVYYMNYNNDYSNSHNSDGHKTGVDFVMTPNATVASTYQLYDRNRMDYYITISDAIDTFDFSVGKTQNTSVANENLIDADGGVTIKSVKSGQADKSIKSALTNINDVVTLQGVEYGSTVTITVALNSDILANTDENIRIDKWTLIKDDKNLITDDRKVIVDNVWDSSVDYRNSAESYFNRNTYNDFSNVGTKSSPYYNITAGKLSISFKATTETSGKYVVDLVKQWLVDLSLSLSSDVGENYPDTWLSGCADGNTLVDTRVLTQTVNTDTTYSNVKSTQSYNLQYLDTDGSFKTLGDGNYFINGAKFKYNDGGLEYPYGYHGTDFDSTVRVFVDNGYKINVFTYHNENYVFKGFTFGTSNTSITSTPIYTTDRVITYHYATLTITDSYYGNSGETVVKANYDPAEHEVHVIVNKGNAVDYNRENGEVSAPEKVIATGTTGTLQGTNIKSTVLHGKNITINTLPDQKYILNKVTVKHYNYITNEYGVRQYKDIDNNTFISSKTDYNTLPSMVIYSDNSEEETSISIIASKVNVTTVNSSGQTINTGDINIVYTIVLENLVGDVEINIDYTRYYWNDLYNESNTSIQETYKPAGTGTANDPFKITNASNWGYIVDHASANSYYAGKYFTVTNDIDFVTRFTPSLQQFNGIIYGNGFTFKNILLDANNLLGVSSERVDYLGYDHASYGYNNVTSYGLIGSSSNAMIQDLNFSNMDLVANAPENSNYEINIGLLIGKSTSDKSIQGINIDADSSISIVDQLDHDEGTIYVGGIIGHNTNGQISYSTNNASITYNSEIPFINSYIGGIVGHSTSSSIFACINTGNIAINDMPSYNVCAVAGIAGYANNSNIISVSNKGSITGSGVTTFAINASGNADVYNVYNTGTVNNMASASSVLYNAYSTLNTIAGSTSTTNYYKGLTDAQMKEQDTYVGFDFDAEWYKPTTGAYLYPMLWFESTSGYYAYGYNDYSTKTTADIVTGNWIDSTELNTMSLEDPDIYNSTLDMYILDSALDLALLSKLTSYKNDSLNGKTFVIAGENAINLSGKYWTPINSGFANNINIIGVGLNASQITSDKYLAENARFMLNGELVEIDNAKIYGMTIRHSRAYTYSNVGFISTLDESSTVRGLDFEKANVYHEGTAGIVVGSMDYATISDCTYISGALYSGYTNTGGLVGSMTNGSKMYGCSITGYNSEGILHETENFGDDYGGRIQTASYLYSSNIGAFVATLNNSSIEESYTNGIILTTQSNGTTVGGFAHTITNGTILNNYSKGLILDNSSNVNNVSIFVHSASGTSLIKNNYSAYTISSRTSVNDQFYFINLNSGTTLTENYYLVDTLSNPKVNNVTFSTTAPSGISQITDSALSDRTAFRLSNNWDFKDIWTYIEGINRDYPVLRSIYGFSITEIEVTIYNPHMYGNSKIQIGDLVINGDEDIFMYDADGDVYSDYANIEDVDATYNDTTKITFLYTVPIDVESEIIVSNTSEGVITSVMFGQRILKGETHNNNVLTEDLQLYTEQAGASNDDVVINHMIEYSNYGLIITFDEREFNVTINSTLTAGSGLTVDQTDKMTVVLVHKTSAGVVDYAYSVVLGNGETANLEDIFNGNLDVAYTDAKGHDLTIDEYGTWTIYLYYPLFYINDTTNTSLSNTIISNNPTILDSASDITTTNDVTVSVDGDGKTIYSLTDVNNSQVALNCLGTFTLDTLVRDVVINITINKPLEYWLHSSVSNTY